MLLSSNLPYDNSVSEFVVISLSNSDDSNFYSWTNWKSPTAFLDFLNTLTRATSPTKVLSFEKSIFAKEPVNEVSPITWFWKSV